MRSLPVELRVKKMLKFVKIVKCEDVMAVIDLNQPIPQGGVMKRVYWIAGVPFIYQELPQSKYPQYVGSVDNSPLLDDRLAYFFADGFEPSERLNQPYGLWTVMKNVG